MIMQMNEMAAEKVRLVVPRPYIGYYPEEMQSNILDLNQFVGMVKQSQIAE